MNEALSEAARAEADVLELGRRLGLLLAAAEMPDEQKAAWASLIPEMNPQQMSGLADALARRIPDAEEMAFADLTSRLGAARSRYEDRVADATAAAEQSLADVEKELTPPTA